MMTPFSKLFWGVLFIFDFNIGNFDILPDVIAYLLFYFGLSELVNNSKHFKTAQLLTLPLIFIAIFDLFTIKFTFIEIVIFILNLLLIYNITMGIAEMAKEAGNPYLEEKARSRWKLYLYINSASILIVYLGLLLPGLIIIFFIPLFIAVLVVLILLMLLMKQADQILYNKF